MPTIAAIATPPGAGGIGIVRLSGPGAREILKAVFRPGQGAAGDMSPRRMRHGAILDRCGEKLDEALAVYMPGPGSFTGEDVAEIQCHGSPVVLQAALEACLAQGARLADRGEFTRRAFHNGRLDLSQAEAVAELIAAPTPEAARYSLLRLEGGLAKAVDNLKSELDSASRMAALGLDFPDDELELDAAAGLPAIAQNAIAALDTLLRDAKRCQFCQHGARIVLAGAPNAGKSSLLNALCGKSRAIVSGIPGTTRDFLEEKIYLRGCLASLIDTAGINTALAGASDELEAMGRQKTWELLADADLILFLLDGAESRNQNEPALWREIRAIAPAAPAVIVWNKCDLASGRAPAWAEDLPFCQTSALTGENVDALADLAAQILLNAEAPASLAPNARQGDALRKARGELAAMLAELERGLPLDLAAARLDAARAQLDDILGLGTPGDILDQIFSRFCIGK